MERGKHNGTAYIWNAVRMIGRIEVGNAGIVIRVLFLPEATRGTVARGNGSTAATVYFARSGRTNRGLRCGWKGYAYIQPRCEFDAAKHRIGHGVGMPQTDGAMRAERRRNP